MATISVKFEWTDFNTNETGYNVYRSETEIDTTALPAVYKTLPADTETFTDTDLVEGKVYYYVFSAVCNDEEVFTKNYKVVAEDYIYSFSTTGDMVILNTHGELIYRNSVGNVFGNNLNVYAHNTTYKTWNLSMDMDGNMFALNNDGLLKKISPNFEEVWSVDVTLNGVRTSYGALIEADIFGQVVLYNAYYDIFQVYSSQDGTLVYDNRSADIGQSRFYGYSIIPTVDKNVFFVECSWYNNGKRTFRIDISKGESAQFTPCYYDTSGSTYASYSRGFSDTEVNTYSIGTTKIYKLDYTGNIMAEQSAYTNYPVDLCNINKNEMYSLERTGRRLLKRNKSDLSYINTPTGGIYFDIDDSSTRTVEAIDNDRFVLFSNSRIRMGSWESQSVLWEHTSPLEGTHHYGFVSGGRQLRTINFDDVEPSSGSGV